MPPRVPPPAAVAVAERRPEIGKPIDVAGEGYEGTIFARQWAPSDAEVRRLERALPAAFRSSIQDRELPLAEYFRQYVGVFDDAGHRRIRVHGIRKTFLREVTNDPHRDEMVVADGGDWFFEADYDPQSGRFGSIYLHGEA